jgi:hypothetical protein
VFCADFDEGVLAQGWDGAPFVIGNASADVDRFVGKSPPASLWLQSHTGNNTTDVGMAKTLATANRFVVEMDIRVDQISSGMSGSGGYSGVANTLVSIMFSTFWIEVAVGDQTLGSIPFLVYEEPTTSTLSVYSTRGDLSVGDWQHLWVEVTLPSGSAGSGVVVLRVDGNEVLNQVLSSTAVTAATPRLSIGVSSGEVGAAWISSIHFDNVLVTNF